MRKIKSVIDRMRGARTGDRKVRKKLRPYVNRVEIGYFHEDGTQVRYVEAGDPAKQPVLFIHGAPGSLNAFLHFLKDPLLLQHFRMISVDRPGYGYSEKGKPFPSIRQQARLLLPLLRRTAGPDGHILVGHSYGGPIAAALSLEAGSLVKGIILVGAAMDPALERVFWISYLMRLRWIVPVLPSAIHVANVEKLAHAEELEKMKDLWPGIRVPVTVIHGKRDLIVPVKNVYFIRNKMVHTNIRRVIIKNAGHLFPWFKPRLIRNELLDFNNLSGRKEPE